MKTFFAFGGLMTTALALTAPLSAAPVVIDGMIEPSDRKRTIERPMSANLNAVVEMTYDCHVVDLKAGEGIRNVGASQTNGPKGYRDFYHGIGTSDCSQFDREQPGLFTDTPRKVGIVVVSEQPGARRGYKLRYERFDYAGEKKRADDAMAAYNYGQSRMSAKDFAAAAAAFQNAATLMPKEEEAHLALGVARGALGESDAAIAAFKQVFALKPSPFSSPSASARLAIAHLLSIGTKADQAGELDRALKAFEAAYEGDRDSTVAAVKLAAIRIKRNDPKAAEIAYHLTQKLPLDPVWLQIRLAVKKHEEKESEAKQDARSAELARASVLDLERQMSEMPVFLTNLALGEKNGKSVISGRLVGNAAPKGTKLDLMFTIIGESGGEDYASGAITAPAKGQETPFELLMDYKTQGWEIREYTVRPRT